MSLLTERLMLIIRKDRVDNVLKAKFRNQSWLAEQMGFHKSYVSQCLNNRCKMSMPFVSAAIRVTGIPYEELFYDDGKFDSREFHGDLYVVEGKPMRVHRYREHLEKIEQELAVQNSC